MAVAIEASVVLIGGGNGGTSAAIDTTNANVLVVTLSTYTGGSGLTFSDSEGNTYTAAASHSGGQTAVEVLICTSPVLSATHTFTVAGTNVYSNLYVFALSGVDAAAPTGAISHLESNGGNTMQPGNVVPTLDGSFLLSAHCTGANDTDTWSIDSGFTVKTPQGAEVGGTNIGGGAAYLLQGSAAAKDVIWTYAGIPVGDYAVLTIVVMPSVPHPVPSKQSGTLLNYSPRLVPILPGSADAFVQTELTQILAILNEVILMTPQSATRVPGRLKDGMQRLARGPWWPVAGQVADAWVYYDGAGQVWRYSSTAPTTA